MALLGAGTGGLAFLMYKAHQIRMDAMRNGVTNQMHLFNPIVQERIKKTLMYFSGGLGATGVMVGLLRNNMFALNHPWMLLFGSLGLLIGT